MISVNLRFDTVVRPLEDDEFIIETTCQVFDDTGDRLAYASVGAQTLSDAWTVVDQRARIVGPLRAAREEVARQRKLAEEVALQALSDELLH